MIDSIGLFYQEEKWNCILTLPGLAGTPLNGTILLLFPFSVSKDRPPEQMQSQTHPEKQVKLSYLDDKSTSDEAYRVTCSGLASLFSERQVRSWDPHKFWCKINWWGGVIEPRKMGQSTPGTLIPASLSPHEPLIQGKWRGREIHGGSTNNPCVFFHWSILSGLLISATRMV